MRVNNCVESVPTYFTPTETLRLCLKKPLIRREMHSKGHNPDPYIFL